MRNVKERVYGKYGNNLTYKKELLDIVEGLGGQLLFHERLSSLLTQNRYIQLSKNKFWKKKSQKC